MFGCLWLHFVYILKGISVTMIFQQLQDPGDVYLVEGFNDLAFVFFCLLMKNLIRLVDLLSRVYISKFEYWMCLVIFLLKYDF